MTCLNPDTFPPVHLSEREERRHSDSRIGCVCRDLSNSAVSYNFLACLNFTLLRPDRNLKTGEVISLQIHSKRLSGKAGTLSLRLEVSSMLKIEGIWYPPLCILLN